MNGLWSEEKAFTVKPKELLKGCFQRLVKFPNSSEITLSHKIEYVSYNKDNQIRNAASQKDGLHFLEKN
ncbi:hypothetical protein D3Z58_14445 [Clostridiaceae bacterium]|nr:hypothetical protein [Clostridiaceae bacterium]